MNNIEDWKPKRMKQWKIDFCDNFLDDNGKVYKSGGEIMDFIQSQIQSERDRIVEMLKEMSNKLFMAEDGTGREIEVIFKSDIDDLLKEIERTKE